MAADPRLSALLEAVADGDRAAFAELYAATSGVLYAVVLRILGRRDWAEEVLQDVYLRIWNNAARYRADRGAPMTWMASIARHRALDLKRADRGREVSVDEFESEPAWTDPAADPLDCAILSAEARALLTCLNGLADAQRRCIVLAFLEGYTHAEVAARLDTPIGTVKSWIRRGQIHLKDCLTR